MRIMTWNINSVRLRIHQLVQLMDEAKPDVVCLQETKCMDDQFPREAIEQAGFSHILANGIKSYNGVAILSRMPIELPQVHERVRKHDARHCSGTIAGIEIHNLYIPSGGDVPDREVNDKFAHKLDFVDELSEWFPSQNIATRKAIIVGDFNIAPLETDVWSHKQLLDVVSHTPIEVEKLTRLQRSVPFADAVRSIIPANEKLYSWWSYRARDWRKSNRGRRLDHIWVTPPLKGRIRHAEVITEARSWERPSDHAPVLIELYS